MKDKILIYHDKETLAPIGGPAGYLNSLHEGIKQFSDKYDAIEFLKNDKDNISKVRTRAPVDNVLLNWAKPLYRGLKHYRYIKGILTSDANTDVNFDNYKAVHFHTTMDLFLNRKKLENYKEKVILTSHSPEPLSMEIIENGYPFEQILFCSTYKKLIEMDEFAFRRADYIVFPCKSADEPYLNKWAEYSAIKQEKIDCYRYLVTGTIPAKISFSKEEIRKKYNIPPDAFVICYVGRHNKIKGFERLKKIGKVILSRHPNVYFLIGGTETPIRGLKHERWIEIGWTNEPHSLTNASDVFVLPNLETYFDLILLEVLSVGTHIVASFTGGNKYFENEDAVYLFENENDCISIIERLMHMDEKEMSKMRVINQNLYKAKFTPYIFAKNYIDLIFNLING